MRKLTRSTMVGSMVIMVVGTDNTAMNFGQSSEKGTARLHRLGTPFFNSLLE
jgi:hypothetical protein